MIKFTKINLQNLQQEERKLEEKFGILFEE